MLFTANASGLSVNGNTIDIADMQSGPYTIQEMQIYLQSTNEPVNIVSAEQNDKTIDIVLASDTDLSAKIQAVLSGSGNGEMIDGAKEESFTPATDEIGTTYYYVTASCEDLTVTSNIAVITVTEIPTLNVDNNVIDITDKTVYSRSSYYAKAVNIKIDGATVEKATEDGETVNIVLDGFTSPSTVISVEFGTSLYRCTMIGHTGSVKLINGRS